MLKLRGIILDWAGTVIDHGSRAPVAALRAIFDQAGVPISEEEARASMGLAKREHIRSLLETPRIAAEWAKIRQPAATGADDLYARFIPQQLEVLRDHSTLIDGAAPAADRMRRRGLKIGTTTGYNRVMLDSLLARAAGQGFVPDFAACPDDVPSGRPDPYMCYLNATRLRVYPLWTLVKIGDTPADIAEGLNAGMWTIGITRTGNEVGLSPAEWEAASIDDRLRLLHSAKQTLLDAGAHYVAESVADCDAILDRIEARMATGGLPY